MFRNLDEFLRNRAQFEIDGDVVPSARDLQISTGVLLLSMAHVDGVFSESEFASLIETYRKQFDLLEEDAARIIEIADYISREKRTLDEFTSVLRDAFNREQLVVVLAMLWKVVLADGIISPRESNLAADIALRLGVDAECVVEAKVACEAGKV